MVLLISIDQLELYYKDIANQVNVTILIYLETIPEYFDPTLLKISTLYKYFKIANVSIMKILVINNVFNNECMGRGTCE